MVNEISVSQKTLTLDTTGKLGEYRTELKRFKKEFNEKATKKDFAKAQEIMQE